MSQLMAVRAMGSTVVDFPVEQRKLCFQVQSYLCRKGYVFTVSGNKDSLLLMVSDDFGTIAWEKDYGICVTEQLLLDR